VTGRPIPYFRPARPLFIREASALFVLSLVLCNKRKKCASLGGVVAATGGDVKEGFGLSLGISWLSGALLFLSERVEEDLMFSFWSIYIEEVFAGFSSP
jgi:hypothetical protein